MTGSMSTVAAALARGDGASDRGKWWISGDQLCQRWTSWMDGNPIATSSPLEARRSVGCAMTAARARRGSRRYDRTFAERFEDLRDPAGGGQCGCYVVLVGADKQITQGCSKYVSKIPTFNERTLGYGDLGHPPMAKRSTWASPYLRQ